MSDSDPVFLETPESEITISDAAGAAAAARELDRLLDSTPLGGQEESSVRARSITVAFGSHYNVHNDFEYFVEMWRHQPHIIARENGSRGNNPHIEACIVDPPPMPNLKRTLERKYKDVLEHMPDQKHWFNTRLRSGSDALYKIGYAAKEGDYVTNLPQGMLDRAIAEYQKREAMKDAGLILKQIAPTLSCFELPTEQERKQRYREEIANRFAVGDLSFRQAINLGTTPYLMAEACHRNGRTE